jgi:hypothetical protein
MPEPAAIHGDEILVRLRARFGVDADAVEFLPLGSWQPEGSRT